MRKQEIVLGYLIGLCLLLIGTYTVIKIMLQYNMSFGAGLVLVVSVTMTGIGWFIVLNLLNLRR